MKHNIPRIIVAILIVMSLANSQRFEYSEVLSVPDLEFFPGVFTGLDVLEEMNFEPLLKKRLAILTNQTAVNKNGQHLLDLLSKRRDEFDIKIIFIPEFGILDSETEQIKLSNEEKDPWFGAKVKSLWGRDFRPDINDLRDVDLIVVDIQDPGIRFFTFMTTVTKVMEAAAIFEKAVMVLDRPNPLNGIVIDGPTVRPRYQSFIGYHLVPIRHGLTVGEFALLVNETGWIRRSERADLTVVPMANWRREMWMDETGLPWVSPAPNIGDVTVLFTLSGMGLLEGTNLSAGIGTDRPYLQFGAPWIYPKDILNSLRRKDLTGVRFSEVSFIPDSLSGLISNPIYRGMECHGLRLDITDRNRFSPIQTVATILSFVSQHYPRRFRWVGDNYVDKLYGHNYLRIFLAQERDPIKLPATWTRDVIQFSQFRERFLLY